MATHPCPAGCGREVRSDYYACKYDWYRLPRELRTRIWCTWRSDYAGHHEAMTEAQQWFDAYPRPNIAD